MASGRLEINEKEKLEEAKHFLSRMIDEQENRKVFVYNLSAFLSAACSVMQYAQKEAAKKKGGQEWYRQWMTSSPLLSYFREKRGYNIHTAPIDPRKHVNIHITEVVRISESVHIKVTDKEGKVKEEREIKEEEKPKVSLEAAPESSVKSESRYEFNDWQGKEDVITLCRLYIQELEKAIQDGIIKGYVTG